MKLKTKYAAGMRDELEGMLGCPVEVVECVTWAKAFPDKLDMLGLPYKAAYASALSMSERLQ